MRASARHAGDLEGAQPALGRIVSMLVLRERPQAVAFIAARTGEGTTTTAQEFVRLLSSSDYKVLLVRSAVTTAVDQNRSLSSAAGVLLPQKQLDSVVHHDGDTPYDELWLDSQANPGLTARVAVNGEFWDSIKGIYDYIVIDSPPLQHSYEGAVLAARADNVVILVEAEATPVAAVTDLRAALEQMGAKILGMLLTKHRGYLHAQ
jgi:Mrp family chromosome partitioning ATPase